MPVDLWEDIIGYTCLQCGKWATHWYKNVPICCSCHVGAPMPYMEELAIKQNTLFQRGIEYWCCICGVDIPPCNPPHYCTACKAILCIDEPTLKFKES